MEKKEEFVGMLQENGKSNIVKQEGSKLPQFACATIASLGAFIIGAVLAWTSPALKFLEDANYTAPIHIDKEVSKWVAAWTPIGAIFGALPAGFFADLLGRKYTLITFTVPWVGCWLLLLFASSTILLYVGRFITGVIVGMFCAVLPMYVTEIAEDSVRGTLGTLFQVFITLGILFDYILGSFNSYAILCEACAGATILFLIGLFFLPESPMYLAKKNRKPEAEQVLRKLRGGHYDVYVEYNDIRKSLEKSEQQTSNLTDVFTPVNIKALTIALGLMLAQQLSGINGVIFFTEQIFEDAGASNPAVCTIIVGVVQTLATLVASVLVDRAGRKILLLISSIGMGACLGVFGYYFYLTSHHADVSSIGWLPLACMVIFFIAFSLGLGPLPWMMSGEVLAPEIKSFGSGVAVATNWICVAIVTFFFKPLTEMIGSAVTFWMFTVVCGIAAAFILFVIPETKGKSIQQIQDELAGKKSKAQLNGNA